MGYRSRRVELVPSIFGWPWVVCVLCDGRGLFERRRGTVAHWQVRPCAPCGASGVLYLGAALLVIPKGTETYRQGRYWLLRYGYDPLS